MNDGINTLDEVGQYLREHGGEKGTSLFERFSEVLRDLFHAYVMASLAEIRDDEMVERIHGHVAVLRTCAGKIRSEFPDMPCTFMNAEMIVGTVRVLIMDYYTRADEGRRAIHGDSILPSSAPRAEQPERADAAAGEGAGS